MSKMRERIVDGRDALERLSSVLQEDLEMFSVAQTTRQQEDSYSRMDTILSVIIKQTIDMEAVPISMRKRLLYERSLAS